MKKLLTFGIIVGTLFAKGLTLQEKQALFREYNTSKVLRDAYYYFGVIYPFSSSYFERLMKSEIIHMQMIKKVIKHYKIPFKSNDTFGKFPDSFKKDFKFIIDKGSKSFLKVIKVSIKEEVDDIDRIEKYKKISAHDDIKALFSIIQRSRKNHYLLFNQILLRNFKKGVCIIMPSKYCRHYKWDRNLHKRVHKEWYFIDIEKWNKIMDRLEPK
ncbi:MAG: DUF2202 domain-containing protein [Nautiliaceae bacterium]